MFLGVTNKSNKPGVYTGHTMLQALKPFLLLGTFDKGL